ncbi:MAG: anti-sigma regulatory factor [Anaerolineae bacterium]|nr:anti-sigma regulatory factor [Anaerolineae bacterium]
MRLPINSVMDVVRARRQGLEMALDLGFPTPEATKIAVVISELGRNIVLYTKGGLINIIPFTGTRKGIKIIAQDQGPGIDDVNLVLTGGYTTSKGMGLGISGSKRIMDEFDVNSVAGVGTKITGVKWLR